jgi:protein CrcB
MGAQSTGFFLSVALVSGGAAAGAVLRWLLGLGLNALFPAIPPGTLAANLIGGYLMGMLIAALAVPSAWGPELRLLLVTGFLGGLTTFSAFSGDTGRHRHGAGNSPRGLSEAEYQRRVSSWASSVIWARNTRDTGQLFLASSVSSANCWAPISGTAARNSRCERVMVHTPSTCSKLTTACVEIRVATKPALLSAAQTAIV